MPKLRPSFTKSPYFIDEPGNWHLKPGVPKEIRAEFEDYMNSLAAVDELDDPGSILGNKIEYPYDR